MIALATVPTIGLFARFEQVQQAYAVIGATFIPLLALVLLVLNGRSAWVGEASRNRPVTVAVLSRSWSSFRGRRCGRSAVNRYNSYTIQ
jgi:hypothetical protein